MSRKHEDGENILHQQDTEADPSRKGVELVPVGELLDHDHRAAERQGDADVNGAQPIVPEPVGEKNAKERAGNHLQCPDHGGGGPGLCEFLHVDLEADDKEKKREAELGEKSDLFPVLNQFEALGTDQDAGRDVTEDQWLANEAGDIPEGGRSHNRKSDTIK